MRSTDSVEVENNVWLHGAVDVAPDIVVYIPFYSQTHVVAEDTAGLPSKRVPPMLRLQAGVLTTAFTCKAGDIGAAESRGYRTVARTSQGRNQA